MQSRVPTLLLVAAVTFPLCGAAERALPEAPAGDEARVRLVLADGATAIAVGEVTRRDGLLVYRTPDGRLASVREDVVTSIEDAVARRAPIPGAEEPTRTAVDRPAKVFDNDDLPTAPLPSTVGSIGGADAVRGGPDSGPDPLPVPTYDTYRDREGRDEAWWRAAIAGVEEDRAKTRTELDRWSRRFKEVAALTRLECAGERLDRLAVRARCAELIAIQEEARANMENAAARLERIADERRALSEEARRSGALPGWLR